MYKRLIHGNWYLYQSERRNGTVYGVYVGKASVA